MIFKQALAKAKMVGVARFELTREGVKVPCLTAWLHPSFAYLKWCV